MTHMARERTLFKSPGEKFIITTHRIRLDTQRWGRRYLASIMLEEIRSCEFRFVSHPLLLVLAVAAFVAGLEMFPGAQQRAVLVGLAGALVFVLLYAATISRVLFFASGGARIYMRTKGLSTEDAVWVVDTVEAAKNDRYLLLAGRQPETSAQS